MKSQRYIITLMAANKVGIVAAVTAALAELGGDVVEVSQTVMQRYFTIILAAEFPKNRSPQEIVEHIREVCRPFGIEVNLKDPEQDELQDAAAAERHYLTVTGEDKPGTIRQIATRLAREGIDITDLYARRGEDRSFILIMELAVPPGVDAFALQRDLEEMGQSAGLAAALQHEAIFAATNDPRPVRVAVPG
ncbi:MAG: glycine cleavage system protein R [Planctomycetaceae bacterium]